MALTSGSPALWRKTSWGRVSSSAATQNAKEELEPLGYLGASLASQVPLSISSSDSHEQEESVPPDVELGIKLQVTRPAPNPFHPDLLSGPGAVSVGAEGAIVGPECLPSESA